MKRISIVLFVLFASLQLVTAQVKSPADAKKAVEKAEAAAQDAKKATKVPTWLKLAEAYIDAYNAPVGNYWVGISRQEISLLGSAEKPLAQETVVISGQPCLKETYATKEMYFNQNGQVCLIKVIAPLYEDALGAAAEAYQKAYEVDVKGSKTKDIKEGLADIVKKYTDEGYTYYSLDDLKRASELFEKAANVSEKAPYSTPDTTALYNAGFTAWFTKDYDRAKDLFGRCMAIEYYYTDGEVFSKLADCYAQTGDKVKSKDILEEGFVKFPQSQSILIGLINYYMTSGEEPQRLFELINEAKKNEPNNASLYYVEGNINKELGKIDEAVVAYSKCAEINPNYEYGWIGLGILYYELALKYQDEASAEMDNTKYQALVEKFNEALKNAIKPFESAYEICQDAGVKYNIAEYLKNIYYRFSSEGQEYMDAYNKYNEIVKAGPAN